MGSWNGTCMISNLPILNGDRVKLVFLHKNTINSSEIIGQSSFVNSNDILTPSFLPITGKYADYGRINNIEEDWNYKIIEEYLKVQLGNTVYVETKHKPITLESWKLTDLIKGIERGDITYPATENDNKDPLFTHAMINSANKDYSVSDDRDLMLSFVLIREDIWDYINDKYVGEITNWGNRDEFYITIDKFCEITYNKHIASIKYKIDVENDATLTELEQMAKLMKYSWDGEVNMFNPEHSNELKLLAKDVYADYFKDNVPERKNIFKDWSELTKIFEFISDSRKSWMIQAGAGVQDNLYNANRLLSNGIIDVCNKNDKEDGEY